MPQSLDHPSALAIEFLRVCLKHLVIVALHGDSVGLWTSARETVRF